MAIDKPKVFKGPEVKWNASEILRMVEEYGFEKACEEIAGEQFQLAYVQDVVRNLQSFTSTYSTTSFHGVVEID